MSTALAAPKVPAEFTGKARVFCAAIAAEDKTSGEMVNLLDGAIRDRVRRGNPVPRRDTLAYTARAWRDDLPQRGRLSVSIDLAKRGKALTIREMRLSSSQYLDAEWTETERGLAIIMVGLDVGPLRYEFSKSTLGHLSMHALGRRFERGSDASDDAIRRDLLVLGQAHAALADRPNGTNVTVPLAYGSWRANTALMRTPRGEFDVGLVVRTFLAEDAR